MAMDDKKEVFLNGDKKVKVGTGFVGRIKKFWKKVSKHEEEEKTMNALEKIGVKITSLVTGKSQNQILKEKEANEIIDNLNKEFSNLIERLENDEFHSEEEINYIVNKCEIMRKNALEDFDKILNSDDLEELEEIKALRDITFEKENLIKEAKEKALSKIIKPEEEKDSESVDTDGSIDNQEEKTDGTLVAPIMSFGVDQTKAQPMPEVPDTAPTAIPTIEPEEDTELDEPELEEPEIEFPELPQEDIEPEETNLDSDTEEPEVEEDNVPKAEPSIEDEEPVVSEGVDITSEMTKDSVDLSDLTQFATYSDYRTAYRKARIDIKDVDRFYNDLDEGNYPSDFYDKRKFEIEKQRMEDEKEYKKLETERAETEKRLREIEEKQAALSEEHTELQARFSDRDAKLAALRKKNVSLKQELVDKDGELKDKNQEINGLQGQLTAAQEVAKQAQAQSYKDREIIRNLEEKIEKEKAQVKELKQELENSKEREAEINKRLEKTTARINKNIELAKKQISSLNDHDDIEKTALEWSITGLKESEKEEKNGPKHFSEKKPKHKAPKEEEKVEEKKSEEKQPAPIFEIPKPVETKEPEKNAEEPKVIAVSTTPDPELQGVVKQDTDGHVKMDFKPLEEITSEKKELEATRADLVSAIEKEAEQMVESNEGKTR